MYSRTSENQIIKINSKARRKKEVAVIRAKANEMKNKETQGKNQ